MKIAYRILQASVAAAVLAGSAWAAWCERASGEPRWWIREEDRRLFQGEQAFGTVVEIATNPQGHDLLVYSPESLEEEVRNPTRHLPAECRKCLGPQAEPAPPDPAPKRRPGCPCGLPGWWHFPVDV